jgi:hypothetical protein
MRQPAVLFVHRYPGPLLGPGSVRSILGESLVKDQLLNMNHFRQRCMKARPDTPTCTIQIAFVLLTRSGAPGGIRTPDLLVSLTEERAIYLALELDRSWTEMTGVNPHGGTISLETASACTIVRVKASRCV